MRLKVLRPGLYGPDDLKPAHGGDAGIDLRAAVDTAFDAGNVVKIPLGVAMQLQQSEFGLCGSRSSTLDKFGILAQEGKIDSGYRGEVHLIGLAVRDGRIERGDRVAQVIVVKIERPARWEIVADLSESDRGAGGFGSTGAR